MTGFRRSGRAQLDAESAEQRASTKKDEQVMVDTSISGLVAGFGELPNELKDEVLYYVFEIVIKNPRARSGVRLRDLATSRLRLFDILPSEVKNYARRYLMSVWMTDNTCLAIDQPEEASKLRHSMAHHALVAVPIDCRSMVHHLELRCTGRVVQRQEVDAQCLKMSVARRLYRCIMMLKPFDELRSLYIDLDVTELLWYPRKGERKKTYQRPEDVYRVIDTFCDIVKSRRNLTTLHIGWIPIVIKEKISEGFEPRLEEGRTNLFGVIQAACGQHCRVTLGESDSGEKQEMRAWVKVSGIPQNVRSSRRPQPEVPLEVEEEEEEDEDEEMEEEEEEEDEDEEMIDEEEVA